MNARTQSFVLLLFGGALVRLASGDALLRYVRPVARPYVLAAGIAILALAVWTIVASVRGRDHAAADGHGHGAASRAAWLVIAPVVAILVIAPPALGSYSAARVPVTLAKPADVSFPPLPPGDPTKVTVVDFAARALWDDGRTLAGRTVSLTGFVVAGRPGGFLISRLVITCCAADAQPIDVGVESGLPPPAADAWVVVTGTYAGVSPSDATLPILRATDVRVISAPANPYD
ncbi:MAG: hypothetical protein JWO57_2958 [Pseudonocardiales bacterium]|nr:hypothetical protein [Pseudonocardiales bacterium]